MPPRRRVAQHRGDEGALRLLDPLLVLQCTLRLGRERLGAGHEPREALRRRVAQLVDAQEAAAPIGERVVGGKRVVRPHEQSLRGRHEAERGRSTAGASMSGLLEATPQRAPAFHDSPA
jgi:hypothetical protein